MRKGSVYLIEGPEAIPTQNMPREKWLELRRGNVGGSDIGAIMGLNDKRSGFEVYCEHKGLVPPFAGNIHTEFGNRIEPVLRKWAQEDLQAIEEEPAIRVYASPYLYRSRNNPRFIANVDGVVVYPASEGEEESNNLAGAEFKTGSEWMSKWWEGEEIPDSYYAQVEWYMNVTGLPFYHIGALIGKEFFLRTVPINPAFIQRAIAEAESYLQLLDAGTPPAPRGTDKDFEILMALHPTGDETQIIMDEKHAALLKLTKEADDAYHAAEARKKELRAQVQLVMGDAKYLVAGGLQASWPRFEEKRIDTALLKAEAPEIFEAYSKSSPKGRLTVTKYKPKKEKKNVKAA